MANLLTRILVSAAGLWAAAWALDGITLAENEPATGRRIGTVLVVAVVFGVVNTVVRPILRFFSLPLIVVTLGLFLVVINAAMLMLTSWFADRVGLAFHVDEFWWTAIWGSLIISVVTMIANALLPDHREVRR